MSIDPLKKLFDVKWGDLGTTIIFFLISGFLIAQSLIKNDSIVNFVKNRLFRLLPAIMVANLIFIILGSLCIDSTFIEYFFSKDTLYFFYRNTILIFDIRPRIGFGLFSENPNPTFINPQWWTLPWNIKMYAASIIIFILPKLIRTPLYFNLIYLIIMVLCLMPSLQFGWWNYILPCFLTGMFFYINKERIPLHSFYFFLSIFLYLILYTTPAIHALSIPLKCYMLFYLAFFSIKSLTFLNSIPELSFGIFLYHMFFQQFLIYHGVLNVNLLFGTSLLISTIFAFLSLKFIEIPINKLIHKWEFKRPFKIHLIKSQ